MTAVEQWAGKFLDSACSLDPCLATVEGAATDDDRLTDYGPEGHEARATLASRALAELPSLPAQSARDKVLVTFLTERLSAQLDFHAAGEDRRELNDAATGPLQLIRQTIESAVPAGDADPARREAGWTSVGTRLAGVGDALAGYRRSLAVSAAAGHVAAGRQVRAAMERCERWAADESLVEAYGDGPQRPSLEKAAGQAAAAYAEFARFLRDELAPRAPAAEAFGRERYGLWVRRFLGAELDLDELYDWGRREFSRIEAEIAIETGGTSATEAIELLESNGFIQGRDAFGAWLQDLLDQTTERLDGTHFDIPPALRRLESRIVTEGGIYYIAPAGDRPGRVWWRVPEDQTVFHPWHAYSTAYHEGVPGHHLQVGYAALGGDRLTGQLALLGGVSGCTEGWALYAERLMDELGYLDQPGARLGYLVSQLLRAVRVVLDIGLHLELDGWTPDRALTTLRDRCHQGPYAGYELARYLGRPAQALTYKVGERIWLEGRAAFGGELRQFHTAALEIGSVGLGQLRDELSQIRS
jgi:uncharacterized protein (DUF885 family)